MTITDLICSECPLETCDEQSLWCAFRWATNPNQAQLKVASVRLIPERLTDAERSRRWRQRNKDRYNEIQREYKAKHKDEINHKRRTKAARERSAFASRMRGSGQQEQQ